MAIIPWRPFGDLERWFFEEGPLSLEDLYFSEFPAIFSKTPKVDIYEEGNDLVARVELPGVNPKDINVELKNNVLKIEAKKEEKKEEKKKGFYKKEISSGYLKRVLPLPVEVLEDKAKADFEDGILEIRVPKKALPKEKKGKKVAIKIKKK